MTSSTDLWSAGSGDTGLRATRWAPAELHHDSPAPPKDEEAVHTPNVDPVEDARTEAYARGVLDGQRQEADSLAPIVAALEAAMEEVQTSRPAWLDATEKNVLALAVAVARQILGKELSTDEDAVRQLVARALTRFPIEESLTIRLHPSDLARISAATLENSASDPAVGRDVRWRADVHIAEGSCVVDGPERMVDGRVDKALLRIYQALVTDDQKLGDR